MSDENKEEITAAKKGREAESVEVNAEEQPQVNKPVQSAPRKK